MFLALVTKETVVELLKSNPNGMFGRDIINVYCKNPSSRLQCKKHINKVFASFNFRLILNEL